MSVARRTPERLRTGLRLAQHDSRTVRVEQGDADLLLRYGFRFDGHNRLPESVVVEGNEVKAFFLSSTVRDRITETRSGFVLQRQWSVLQAGGLRLALTIDVLELTDGPKGKVRDRSFRYLFPGVDGGLCAGRGLGMYRGERTALPACVAVAGEGLGICLSAVPTGSIEISVGLERVADENGAVLRVVFEMPPREWPAEAGVSGPAERPAREPPAGRGRPAEDTLGPWGATPGDGSRVELQCSGGLDQAVEVQISLGAPDAVYPSSLSGSLARHRPRREPRHPAVREEARRFLASHVVEKGGVCGLRTGGGAEVLSASAGAEMAALLCRLYPGDDRIYEQALRLADFCLTAQHPSGLFYERYSTREGTWVGLRGEPPGVPSRAPTVSVEESSRVASSLLDLGDLLQAMRRPAQRYTQAGRRMVDAFLDLRGVLAPPPAVMTPDAGFRAEEGLGAIRFLHPLLRVADRDTRERYRKAATAFAAQMIRPPPSALELPVSRVGRGPDSKAAVLLLEAALEAMARKIKVTEVDAMVAALLPWLHVGGRGEPGLPQAAGCLIESFARPRLKPRPYQIAYLCGRFSPLCGEPLRGLLLELSRAALATAGDLPMGTYHVRRLRWPALEDSSSRDKRAPCLETGPVDARDFVLELGYCLRLEDERLW
jgi:hypothetical protein